MHRAWISNPQYFPSRESTMVRSWEERAWRRIWAQALGARELNDVYTKRPQKKFKPLKNRYLKLLHRHGGNNRESLNCKRKPNRKLGMQNATWVSYIQLITYLINLCCSLSLRVVYCGSIPIFSWSTLNKSGWPWFKMYWMSVHHSYKQCNLSSFSTGGATCVGSPIKTEFWLQHEVLSKETCTPSCFQECPKLYQIWLYKPQCCLSGSCIPGHMSIADCLR